MRMTADRRRGMLADLIAVVLGAVLLTLGEAVAPGLIRVALVFCAAIVCCELFLEIRDRNRGGSDDVPTR